MTPERKSGPPVPGDRVPGASEPPKVFNGPSEVLDRIGDGIVSLDRSWRYTYLNEPGARMLGRARESLLGRHIWTEFPDGVGQPFHRAYERAMETGETVVLREYYAPFGRWFENRIHPSAHGLTIHFTDITAEAEAQEALRRSLDHMEITLASVGDAVLTADQDGRVRTMNAAAETLTGWVTAEAFGRPLEEVVELMRASRVVSTALVASARDGAVRWGSETPTALRRRDGTLRAVTGSLAPITDRDATKRGIVVVLADREAERAALLALVHSERHLDTTLRSIGDAVIVTDVTGRVTRLNGTAERLTGWTSAAAVGRPLGEVFRIVRTLDRTPIEDPVARVLAQGDVVALANHTSLLARDGAEYQIADTAAPIRGDDGALTGVVLVFSDVTAQYRVQQALAASERRLRTIIETEPECVKVVSATGELLEMNPAGLAMLEASSVEDVRAGGLVSFIVPAQRADFVGLHRAVIAGERGTLEFEVVGRRGTRRWLETHATPLADPEGGSPMLLGITRDITERKRAEEERHRMEAQLRAAERMEAIGQLAGGIAHDFNNLLSVINNTAELAADGLPDGTALRDDLLEIHRAGERAAGLTSQLLSLSRKQLFAPETLDVNELVGALEPMLARLVREDILLSVERTPHPCLVHADRSQLERALVNLAVNARDAMPRGGRLWIRIAAVRLGDDGAALSPALGPGEYVEVSVRDEGGGMDAETLAHVFEPFFTTKRPGQGTGLGLSSAYGTAVRSGGAFGVESAPGHGSTFRMLLPRVSDRRVSPARGATAAAVGGHETILVVDDEPTLVRVAMRLLETSGYRTLGATSAAEALRLAHAMRGPLHLLLTDVVMPAMSGPELAVQVRRRHPEVRVILTTGYGEDARPRSAGLEDARIIGKPYAGIALLGSVRDMLDAAKPG